MNFTEWNDRVLSYLDVDATRRGIEPLRASFLKAAMADLKHFVPYFSDGRDPTTYAGIEVVPFGEKAAEAAAMYMKARIVRATEKDLSLVASYQRDYETIRRLLVRESGDSDDLHDVAAITGDTLPFNVYMTIDETGAAWVDFTNYKVYFEMTGCDGEVIVSKFSGLGFTEASPTIEVDGGIDVTSEPNLAAWEISNTLTEDFKGEFDYTVKLENTATSRKWTIKKGVITFE